MTIGSGIQKPPLKKPVQRIDEMKVDQRIARDALLGEVKFKQIRLVDKRNQNIIMLLVRK